MKNLHIFEKYLPVPENLIPILHDIQNSKPEQYLSKDDMRETAAYLNTTLAQVYGVATYYTMFSIRMRGKKIVRVCKSPVCNSLGSKDVLKAIKQKLSIIPGQSTPDGEYTLETCECLGRCGKGPSLMINQKVITELKGQNLEDFIRQL